MEGGANWSGGATRSTVAMTPGSSRRWPISSSIGSPAHRATGGSPGFRRWSNPTWCQCWPRESQRGSGCQPSTWRRPRPGRPSHRRACRTARAVGQYSRRIRRRARPAVRPGPARRRHDQLEVDHDLRRQPAAKGRLSSSGAPGAGLPGCRERPDLRLTDRLTDPPPAVQSTESCGGPRRGGGRGGDGSCVEGRGPGAIPAQGDPSPPWPPPPWPR